LRLWLPTRTPSLFAVILVHGKNTYEPNFPPGFKF
jgi:hypothetical protein